MYGNIPVGSVIYKVGDDTLIAENGTDKWTELLSTPSPPDGLGWCVDSVWYTGTFARLHSPNPPTAHFSPGQNTTCCSALSARDLTACFEASDTSQRCLDPLRFLSDMADHKRRCVEITDCGGTETCVRPRTDQELVVLTMHLPAWLRAREGVSEKTIVWQGARAEILDEGVWFDTDHGEGSANGWITVRVGHFTSRHAFLPLGLPSTVEMFFV